MSKWTHECTCRAGRHNPLNFAVARGDVEIVKILLKNGADPFIKNDLGMDAFKILIMVLSESLRGAADNIVAFVILCVCAFKAQVEYS